ncbi:MAG TPA: D-alanyl-D-alanine carboxypeptidase/D-alanyl-D-alanine-endopeptidase [Acidimicrobiales bacterium]
MNRAPGAGAHYAAYPPPGPQRAHGARRWALPVALALVALTAGLGVVRLEQEKEPAPVGMAAVPATPVLSARRVPELLAAPVADRRLGAELTAWLAQSPPNSCLVVQAGGRGVFAHNPALPVTGASTQKLLTATGLLLARGPDATFDTKAEAAAAPAGGVVAGDLYLVGGGDAELGQAAWSTLSPPSRPRAVHDIDALAASIAAAGVTQIQGSVVGDGSRYDDQLYQPSLAPRLIDQEQIGPIDALMTNDGYGGFQPESGSQASARAAADPAADAARVLTDALAAHGVTVAGAPRSGVAPADATTVATMSSPPISQVVGEMLSNSDNETAESAMKEIGLATSDAGTFAAGATGLSQLLSDAGIPMDGVRIVDGTGLTTEDQFTCTTLVDVLTHPDTGPVLRNGLAVAGQTGTLALRWRGTPVAGNLRAKTGTLRNVTALAGEVAPAGGAVTFAYVANVPDPATVTSDDVDMEALPGILLGYGQGLDVAALGPLPATPAG